MMEIADELEKLGIEEGRDVNMKELRKAFKRKSLAMLPEKHPTVVNAHAMFEDINSAFVKVLNINFYYQILHNMNILRF
jgi:lipopolysaccharide biosynthesis protein